MPINELLSILRKEHDSHKAWIQVLDLCMDENPSDLWKQLPSVNLIEDIASAKAWLEAQLPTTNAPTLVYLGLDTLNMEGGQGSNIEIGWRYGDTKQNTTDWIYADLTYGDSFLIAGLSDIYDVYSRPEWDQDFSFADYVLFLAYSGIVLSGAFKDLKRPNSSLFAWGFHDGDVFPLCRIDGVKVDILC